MYFFAAVVEKQPFHKKCVFKKFENLTEKHIKGDLFINKVPDLPLNFVQKDSDTGAFLLISRYF